MTIFIAVFAGIALAQTGESDRCSVDSLDVTTKEALSLGDFNTEIGKDLSTLQVSRIRGTKLFLVARVLYDDESMVSDELTGRGAESVSLQLWIVKSRNATAARESTPRTADAFAEAQYQVATFDIGRVMLIDVIGSTKRAFMMKCWRQTEIAAISARF